MADRIGDAELGSFCDAWLDKRVPLVKRAEEELAWFAAHPELAIKRARRFRGRRAPGAEAAPN